MEQALPPSWNSVWTELFVAGIIIGPFALVTTVLRFVARERQTTRTGRKEGLCWDDWLILPAEVIDFLALGASMFVAEDLKSNPQQKVSEYYPCWYFYAIHLSWILIHGLASLSILALYSRHFGHSKKIKRWINFWRVVVILWTIGALLWTLFGEGLPLSRYCTVGPNERYKARIITTSTVHFIINLVILITPIPLVSIMPRKSSHKFFLISLYLLGLITLGFSIVRLVYLMERLHNPEPEMLHYSVMSVMWSLIEINTSITVVNLPTLMPILDWCLDLKQKLNDHMAKASHGDEAIDGILLTKPKPRKTISISSDDPENPQAAYDEEVNQHENQARLSSGLAAELGRQTLSYQTTSSGSLQERETSVPYRITNP